MTRSSPPGAIHDPQPDDRRAQDVAGIEERGVDPGRDLDLLPVADGPERRERPLGVLGRVERLVEVDRRAPAAGRAARPRGRAASSPGRVGLDGAGSTCVVGRTSSGPSVAGLGEGDRRRVLVGLLAVVGRGLVGVALLPARVALRELLVELAGVEQDERRQLDRAGRRVDRARGSRP